MPHVVEIRVARFPVRPRPGDCLTKGQRDDEERCKQKPRDAADPGVSFKLIRHRPHVGTHAPNVTGLLRHWECPLMLCEATDDLCMRSLITLQFLIITYVEGRVLGAARSCWASLGPWCNLRDAPGLVHGCRSDPNPCRHITRLAVDQGEFRMLSLSQHRPVNPRFDQCGGLPVGEPPHRHKPAEDFHE